MEKFIHPKMPGVTVYVLERTPENQRLLVIAGPGVEIPKHMHVDVTARMKPLAGSGVVISDNFENGREVFPGDLVVFEKNQPHGFQAGKLGLVFESQTEGGLIVGSDESWNHQFV